MKCRKLLHRDWRVRILGPHFLGQSRKSIPGHTLIVRLLPVLSSTMASQRLSFLYPHLFRPCPRTSYRVNHRGFSNSTSRAQQQVPHQRHGTAVEPPPPSKDLPPLKEIVIAQDKPPRNDEREPKEATDRTGKEDASDSKPEPEPVGTNHKKTKTATDAPSDVESLSSSQASSEISSLNSQTTTTSIPNSKPLETVLHLPAPSSSEARAHKPPHLQATPYVHHFDTYTLVRDLERGGFKFDSAVTTMKAVRGILADNFALAKDGLVSKSDVENETYLFRAACSELRTEIQNSRKAEADHMRTARSQLQHEVDILNQKLTQELLTLKDDLKGMFDDRKMAVRTEQRSMESSIQELNYKITVSLNSDMKSEVEGLRWVLTRRAAMAIVTMACKSSSSQGFSVIVS